MTFVTFSIGFVTFSVGVGGEVWGLLYFFAGDLLMLWWRGVVWCF